MKKMIVAVAFLVLGAVVGVIVLLGSEEKVVPQAKVAKVTITCELGRSEFDVDCDGIADTAAARVIALLCDLYRDKPEASNS